ncbi:GNAT family N-acetyltransferase [Pseudonocardia sp. ICBG1293]|uniref:GNAT family N-acetyltransferase n=1 Tax=Pseudonocardia sp. ICBG1293 TaxID=2844382 RepID=UPI001CC9CDD5
MHKNANQIGATTLLEIDSQAVTISPCEDTDAATISEWWQSQHIDGLFLPYPRLAKIGRTSIQLDAVTQYLNFCRKTGDANPYLVRIDNRSFGYLETYQSTHSPLTPHPAISTTDRGIHFMIGDPRHIQQGWGTRILTRVADMLFDTHADMGQIMAEPLDINTRTKQLCTRIGLAEIGRIDIGHRVSRLYVLGRGQ